MGVDYLFGVKRHCAADQRLPRKLVRSETFLSRVHRLLHTQLILLWYRPEPRNTAAFPGAARRLRWGLAADDPGNPRRYIPPGETRIGVRAVWNHHRLRSCNWSDAGRLDYR